MVHRHLRVGWMDVSYDCDAMVASSLGPVSSCIATAKRNGCDSISLSKLSSRRSPLRRRRIYSRRVIVACACMHALTLLQAPLLVVGSGWGWKHVSSASVKRASTNSSDEQMTNNNLSEKMEYGNLPWLNSKQPAYKPCTICRSIPKTRRTSRASMDSNESVSVLVTSVYMSTAAL